MKKRRWRAMFELAALAFEADALPNKLTLTLVHVDREYA